MPSSFVSRTGLSLTRTPSYRHQAPRRRLAFVAALLGVAMLSGLIGALAGRGPTSLPAHPATGPFSYFPSQ